LGFWKNSDDRGWRADAPGDVEEAERFGLLVRRTLAEHNRGRLAA
jgi:hypothetical protein